MKNRFFRILALHFGTALLLIGSLSFCVDEITLSKPCSHLLHDLTGDRRLQAKVALDKTAGAVFGDGVEVVPVRVRIPEYCKYFLLSFAGIGMFMSLGGKSGKGDRI